MKEFKGKPGPWHWEGKVLRNDAHILGGDGWAFNDADKSLIAAAPELLEALIKLVDIVDDMVHGPSTDAAHAAIKKALGEKQ